MKPAIVMLLIVTACAWRGPKPALQNPTPMVENTRAHERVQQRPLSGRQFTVEGVLPTPVEVLITPAVRSVALAPRVSLDALEVKELSCA